VETPHVKYPPPLSYGSGFFLKKRHYYAFIAKQVVKSIFSMDFHPKPLKFLILLDLMDINVIYHKKNLNKNSIHTLVFKKYTSNFSCYVIGIISSSIYIYIYIYSIHSSSSKFIV